MFGIKQTINKDCEECLGFGYKRDCLECNNGYINQQKKYILKIKKGCNEGDKYSVENSTIIFIIKQYKHPRFLRHDNDLILHKSISLYEAVSCLKIQCKHLNGNIYTFSTVNTIQNDIIYQLEKLGMPTRNKNKFGNLYVKFDILLPLKCNLTTNEDKILKNIFSIAKYDSEITNDFNKCELQTSNEQLLDISLIRLIRSNHH